MIITFLKIKVTQLLRSIKDIGIFRIIFVLLLLAVLFFAIYKFSQDTKKAYYISTLFILLIFLYNIKRSDIFFLKINFKSYNLLLFSEYLFYALPVVINFIIFSQWIPLLILISGIYIISLIKINLNNKNKNYKIIKIIPDEYFEWKSGIRSSFFFIVPLWLIGIIFSFFIGTIPVIIFILGIFPAGFYSKCEPYQMVIAYEMKTSKFLFTKIKSQIYLFTIMILPLIVLFIIFHYEVWYIVIAEYIIFIFIHTYQILTKYAFFESNDKSSAAQIFEILGILGLLIPLFLPLVWIFSIYFYFKSKTKLNIYLNDFN